MFLRNTKQILMIAMWISASMILMTTSTGETTINQPNAGNGSEKCPEYCNCTNTFVNKTITARCTKLVDDEYSGPDIRNFVLEGQDIKLGKNDLHARVFDHVESFGVMRPNQNLIPTNFESFPHMIIIDNQYKGIVDIHPNAFKNKTQLKFLAILQFKDFVDNRDLTGGYLFDAPSIKSFFFSILEYSDWSSSTFTKMSNLTKFILRSPKFKMVPEMFIPLRGLLNLEIHSEESWNYVGKNDFINLPKLQNLIIGDEIKIIHEDAFLPLSQLEELNINSNNIVSFTENHLRNNPHLKILQMSYNENLKRLPVFKLNSSSSDNYKIYRFDCSGCGLESITDGTFNAMPALKNLNLRNNRLKTLPRSFFKSLISLESLDLSENLISNIPENMFEGANELLDLNLRKNPITVLDMTPFLASPKLENLNLAECQIETWRISSTPHNSLRFLSIGGNKLKDISTKHLERIPNISKLQLFNNPIDCDELKHIKMWSLLRNVTTEFYAFYVSNYSYCTPYGNESCWDKVEKLMCSPNYTSMLNEIYQEQDEFLDDVHEENSTNGSASVINQLFITLFLIVTAFTAAINNSRILFI